VAGREDYARGSKLVERFGPGDAIYIPPLWWHHVESPEPFNALVNYWWHAPGGPPAGQASGFDSLRHAILNLRRLPPGTRRAWRALFQHYIFAPADAVESHILMERRGMLGEPSPDEIARLRAQLAGRLS
jgi:hypothetical protein